MHMAIPYRTAKFKSTNNIILAIAILGSTAKLIPANISGYTVYSSPLPPPHTTSAHYFVSFDILPPSLSLSHCRYLDRASADD